MIKTKVAFLKGRLLFSQSEQSEMFSYVLVLSGAYFQPTGLETADTGSCRIRTEEVSKWIRSCSIDIQTLHHGSSWVTGNTRSRSFITERTAART